MVDLVEVSARLKRPLTRPVLLKAINHWDQSPAMPDGVVKEVRFMGRVEEVDPPPVLSQRKNDNLNNSPPAAEAGLECQQLPGLTRR